LPEIFARFDAARAAFLRSIFEQAEHARTWSRLNLETIGRSLNQPRQRLVAAINYLEEQGDLKLQVAGVRQGYRRKRADLDLPRLTQSLVDRFTIREGRDIGRMHKVLEFADHEGCRTRYLVSYFGQERDRDCGHCDWCEGSRPGKVPPAPARPLG